jgi:hypothetical protein
LVIAAAVTTKFPETECVWLPEVPVSVTDTFAAGAVTAAVSVVLCAVPGVSMSVAGLAVTPVGSPEIVTVTVPLKEFKAVARTLT